MPLAWLLEFLLNQHIQDETRDNNQSTPRMMVSLQRFGTQEKSTYISRGNDGGNTLGSSQRKETPTERNTLVTRKHRRWVFAPESVLCGSLPWVGAFFFRSIRGKPPGTGWSMEGRLGPSHPESFLLGDPC